STALHLPTRSSPHGCAPSPIPRQRSRRWTEAAMPDNRCVWCGKPFKARQNGGSRQTFCHPSHRVAFHSAARRWAERAITAGALTIAELQNGALAPCTLAVDARTTLPVAG